MKTNPFRARLLALAALASAAIGAPALASDYGSAPAASAAPPSATSASLTGDQRAAVLQLRLEAARAQLAEAMQREEQLIAVNRLQAAQIEQLTKQLPAPAPKK